MEKDWLYPALKFRRQFDVDIRAHRFLLMAQNEFVSVTLVTYNSARFIKRYSANRGGLFEVRAAFEQNAVARGFGYCRQDGSGGGDDKSAR